MAKRSKPVEIVETDRLEGFAHPRETTRLIGQDEALARAARAIRSGRPTDHLPNLSPLDVVYTSGAPAMTEAVAQIARAAGAKCYTDPFVASSRPADPATVVGRLTGWLNSPRSGPPIVRPARKQASRTGAPRAAFGNAR